MAQRVTRFQPLPQYNGEDHPEWLLMEAILRKWIAEISSPVLVCPLPIHQVIEETCAEIPYQKRFETLADSPRVQVHDVLPTFRSFSPEQRRAFRFKKDIHWTPTTHGVFADELAPLIQSIRG